MSLKHTPVTQQVPVSIIHSQAIAVVVFSAPVTPTDDMPDPAVRVEVHVPIGELSVVRGVTSIFGAVVTYLSSNSVGYTSLVVHSASNYVSIAFDPNFAIGRTDSVLHPGL